MVDNADARPLSSGDSPALDILIPTFQRPTALAVTLTSLLAQSDISFRVVIADQSDLSVFSFAEVQAVVRVLEANGRRVETLRNLPRQGLAQQRQFLLEQSRARYALFIDDDLILAPGVVGRMLDAIEEEQCGFVGRAVLGLSYLDERRPHEQAIEFWDRPVEPEVVTPGSAAWARHRLHNAANLHHVAEQYKLTTLEQQRKYRIAWVGGCVLYDVAKLKATGGFDFWRELPPHHCGEDVLAQLRVMARFGGCGLIPSCVYHQELPTTVPDRSCDAPKVLPIIEGAADRVGQKY